MPYEHGETVSWEFLVVDDDGAIINLAGGTLTLEIWWRGVKQQTLAVASGLVISNNNPPLADEGDPQTPHGTATLSATQTGAHPLGKVIKVQSRFVHPGGAISLSPFEFLDDAIGSTAHQIVFSGQLTALAQDAIEAAAEAEASAAAAAASATTASAASAAATAAEVAAEAAQLAAEAAQAAGAASATAAAGSASAAIAAEAAAEAAQALAETAEANAGSSAEAAAAAALAAAATVPALGSDLLNGRDAGMLVDATLDAIELAVEVLDQETPANNYVGSLFDFGVNNLPTPKLCVQADGSLKYNAHNDILRSEDFNTTWTRTNVTAAAGQVGPDGSATDASLLTTTGTSSASISQVVAVLANRYRTNGFKVKAGTAARCYIAVTDNSITKRAWFNPSTGLFGTVDAGLTAFVSTDDEDGNPLEPGWYYISAFYKTAGTSDTLRLGLCDADNAITVTSGVTLYATHAEFYRGVKRLKYLKTTTVSIKDIPYDWTPGFRAVRLDVNTNYRGRSSDDLTNATYWALTNCTAALDAVGPHGEPCTTITVGSDGATAEQAVTSSGTPQVFFAYVRRKVGSGTIEMSMDGGATYTDVSSMVGEIDGSYGLAWKKQGGANPTVRFRFGTAGDEFEIALANVAATTRVPPAVPSALIDFSSSADDFSIPTTKFPTGIDATTAYIDVWEPPDAYGLDGGVNRFGFFGAGLITSAVRINTGVDNVGRLEHHANDGDDEVLNFGNFNSGGRLQAQIRVETNNHSLAYNGNAPFWNLRPAEIAFTSFQFVAGQSIWLRRLLIVPEAISDDNDDLRLFKLDTAESNINPGILATAHNYKYGTIADTNISRIPGIEILSQRGDVCQFITVWGLRHSPGHPDHPEDPQRAMQRRWEFNRATNALTPLEDPTVLFETASWVSDLGGLKSYTPFKITWGPWRGRLFLVYIQQDSVSGGHVDDDRNIYIKYSDDNGDTWSAGVKILDKDTFSASPGFVAPGENSTSFQFQAGPQAGRVYISLNVFNSTFGVMWCDDFKVGGDGSGLNWSYTTTRVHNTAWGGGALSEPAVAFWPDDTIVLAFRNSAGATAAFAKSTDDGVSFNMPVAMAGENASETVNCGFIQDDPTGGLGRRGRLIFTHGTLTSRTGHKVQSIFDDTITLVDTYQLFPLERFAGYGPVRKAFDDDNIYLIHIEVQPFANANTQESMMIAAFRY